MANINEDTVLIALHKLQQGNYRRFFAPEYSDKLWIGRQLFNRIWNKLSTVDWFGIGAMQSPVDFMAYMECIVRMKPRVLIETGTASGGSAAFFADVLKRIHGQDNFRVITIDHLKTQVNYDFKTIPEVTSIIGSSIDPKVVSDIYNMVQKVPGPVMVTLDSDHGAEHVTKELVAYVDIVSPGQYLIVQDTYLGLYCGGNVAEPNPDAKFDYSGNPLAAIEAFLSCDNRFEIDPFPERWVVTQCPFGFLRRKEGV